MQRIVVRLGWPRPIGALKLRAPAIHADSLVLAHSSAGCSHTSCIHGDSAATPSAEHSIRPTPCVVMPEPALAVTCPGRGGRADGIAPRTKDTGATLHTI
jgi:hypothetical protein